MCIRDRRGVRRRSGGINQHDRNASPRLIAAVFAAPTHRRVPKPPSSLSVSLLLTLIQLLLPTEHVDPGRGRVRGHLSPLEAPLHPKTSHLADATTLFLSLIHI